MNSDWRGDHNPILLWFMKHDDTVALVISIATAAVTALILICS